MDTNSIPTSPEDVVFLPDGKVRLRQEMGEIPAGATVAHINTLCYIEVKAGTFGDFPATTRRFELGGGAP